MSAPAAVVGVESTELTDARAAVLRGLGAGEGEVMELLLYNQNAFAIPEGELPPLPLDDEPFVAAWEGYAVEAERVGAAAALRERLVQLRFPIAEGISGTDAYRAATQRGAWPTGDAPGLALEVPGALGLFLHPTAAGRIPVLLTTHRADFVALVRALTRRGEPAPAPASQGAAMVAGYNNWDRVARLREAWERGEVEARGAAAWPQAFQALRERKELYQDRFILLSGGPYSGVPAGAMGVDEAEWARLSVTIRLEHECAHYFTRRVFGSMRNTLLDELIADYAGIAAAAERYRADWFLRFLGLEHPTDYRAGGRLENYRGTPPLSDGALAVLQRLVRRAARAVEAVDAGLPDGERGMDGRARMLLALASFTLEEMAADGAEDRLRLRLGGPVAAGL